MLEDIKNKYQEALAVMTQEEGFTVSGFDKWYERLHGNELPRYAREEWIRPIHEAKANDMGKELFSFRGSWKTTTVPITWGAWFVGHFPHLANLVVSASGSSANAITEAVKNIIEFAPAWKACFPHVVPDYNRGWGQEGYEVMNTLYAYEEWRELNAARKDPSLLGLGIGSKTLIGKHPDGFLILDDILDEDNTASVRQMSSVATKVTGTILPFIVRDDQQPKGKRLRTWPIVVGTPWTEDDVYQDIKNTGQFDFSAVPIMRECSEDTEGAVFIEHEKLNGWFLLTEPLRFGVDSIKYFYDLSGHKEFMRMYMLDTSVRMEGEGLEFRLYPHDKIDLSWPMVCGVDYMSMIKDANVDLRNRAYYAQCYLFEMPDGRAVVGGGWYGRPTQSEAETRMESAEAFPGHKMTVFESDGKGEEALQVFIRNPNLTLVPRKTKGQGKPERLERQLGPWLENGRVLISDGDSEFLNFLRKCLNKYPDYFKDPIDALYWAVMGMPHVLTLEKPKGRLPKFMKDKKRSKNPIAAFGGNW